MPERVPIILFILATVVITAGCLIGLKAVHRKLEPRRIVLAVLVSITISWVIWTAVARTSEPAPPGEGPDPMESINPN